MATQSLMRRLPPVSVMIAGLVLAIMLVLVLFAPLIAPMDPRDVSSYSLIDMEIPPAFMEGGDPRFLLGTDNQGRDLVSVILFGLRISVVIGLGAVLFAAAFGVVLGLVAGFFGGLVDNVVMRIADVLVSFPTILVALLISGIARAQLSADTMLAWAPLVLIFSIAINEWVQYARTVRASTMVEVARDYVRAAKVIGLPSGRIMGRHILPNVMSSVMDLSLARHTDPHRQPVPVLRPLVDRCHAGGGSRHPRARRQRDRRLSARSLQPETDGPLR
jgi:peptide/nickel transport system permease protein